MTKLLLLFLLISSCVNAQVGQIIRGQTPDGKTDKFIQLNPEGALKIEGNIELGDVTVDAVPSYKDDSGEPQRAIVDDESRVIVNIGSDTINLVDTLEAIITEIENSGVNASETVLIDKLQELLAATASETSLVAAIDAVTTAVNAIDEITVATETIGLIDKLQEILAATASETALTTSINTVKEAIEAYESPSVYQCDVVTVGNTVVEISVTGTVKTLENRRSVTIQNNSSTISLWFKTSGIAPTVGQGHQITPFGIANIPAKPNIVIKMIASEEIPVTVSQEAK